MTENRPRAFTIVEVTAAAAILAVILGTLVPAVVLVQRQRAASALDRRALAAADNLLERVLALDWEAIHAGVAGAEIAADDLLSDLPAAAWKLSVVESGELAAKRVTVEVSYGTRAGRSAVHLTAWAYSNPNREGA